MRSAVLLVVFVLLWAAARAQTAESSNTEPSYEGQKVESIEVIANPHTDTSYYQHLIVQAAGESYSTKQIQASIKALEQTNAFSDVRVEVLPGAAGLKLAFILEPAYYIGVITFPGASNIFSYARLLQVTEFQDQTPYQADQVSVAESALLKFFASQGYFEAKVHSAVLMDDKNQLTNIAFNVQLGRQARIGRVEIAGPTASEQKELQGMVRSLRARFTGALLKPGKRYDSERLTNAVALIKRKLAGRKHPASTVKVEPPVFHPDTNRADISIEVDTGPEVEVRIEGAKLSWVPFLASRRKRTLLPIYSEASVDPDLITDGERNLANYFQKKGYFNVKVTTDTERQGDMVLIVYRVDRGQKHRVRDISFRGNHHLSSGDLMGQVAIKRHRWLISRGTYSRSLLEASVNGIEGLYKDNGFERIKVTPETVDRDNQLYITFNIAEGDRTTVANLTVTGNRSIPLSQLRPKRGFQQAAGKPFSPRRVTNDRNRLAAEYLDRGFLNSEVKTVVSRRPDDANAVDVTYQITENQEVRISNVLYLGQQRTRVGLIRKSAKLAPEQPLSEGKLLAGESNLYNLEIFDWASVGPRRQITTQSDEAALVKVHEAKRNTITYGFGIEISRRGGNTPTDTVAVPGLPTIHTNGANVFPSEQTFVSPRGSIEFTRRNMRGQGETAAISVLLARLNQQFLATYTNPSFRGSSWQELNSLSYQRTTENPLFEARLADASVEFLRNLNAKRTTQLQLRYDFNKTQLSNLLVPGLVLPSDQNVRLSYVSGTLIHDTRDKPLDAHHGVFQTLDLRIVPSAFGSSTNFIRLYGQAAYYKPLFGMVFANSIRLGLANPFAGATVPTSQLFFAGGGTTLRGFPIDEAGPIRYVPFCAPGQTTNCTLVPVPVGGIQLFIFNSELRYPIPIMKDLGGVVFYDGGNIYAHINFPNFINNYSNTLGIGLRYSTPIGPIRFDIGHNLNAPRGINANQFFISIGQAF
jgi:outer membrane protein insertion porin family